jgi:hypothetical protein
MGQDTTVLGSQDNSYEDHQKARKNGSMVRSLYVEMEEERLFRTYQNFDKVQVKNSLQETIFYPI